MNIPELSMNDLKSLFFEFLAKDGDGWGTHIGNFYGGWLIQKLGLPPYYNESLPGGRASRQIDTGRELVQRYKDMSWEAADELVKEGYIQRDRSQSEGFYKLTTKAKQQWEEKGRLGVTVSALVESLEASATSIDEITLAFLDESCKASKERLPIASLVLLGIASEKAVLELEDSLLIYVNNQSITKKHRTQISSILQRVREIQDLIKSNQRQIIGDYKNVDANKNIRPIISDLISYFDTIFQIIRITRNDKAHPDLDMSIDTNSLLIKVETYLLASEDYFQTIFRFKDILDSI